MSKFDMVRFEKGQIWEIYFKDGNEPKGREQGKNRPWIILSTRKFNESAGMVTCAPLTTRDTIVSPAQVIFQDMRGKNSVILCEQMRTFDYKSGSYVFEYMGCVSEEVIELLDNALSIHLGLKFAPSTLDRLYKSIESIMRSIEMTRTKIEEPKFSDDDVIRFAEMLESLMPTPKKEVAGITKDDEVEEVVVHKTEKTQSTEKDPENLLTMPAHNMQVSNESNTKVSSCSESKTQRNKWTEEMCKEFLNDMETLPMKEVMNKWGMTKKTQVYQTKHYVKSMMAK